MSMKTEMRSLLALVAAMSGDCHGLFCTPKDEPEVKDPNSAESKEKLAKAEAKRKRKGQKRLKDTAKEQQESIIHQKEV